MAKCKAITGSAVKRLSSLSKQVSVTIGYYSTLKRQLGWFNLPHSPTLRSPVTTQGVVDYTTKRGRLETLYNRLLFKSDLDSENFFWNSAIELRSSRNHAPRTSGLNNEFKRKLEKHSERCSSAARWTAAVAECIDGIVYCRCYTRKLAMIKAEMAESHVLQSLVFGAL